MKLVNLNLKNYRKYEDETIDFPDGLVGIVGPNGAGKSTILEAVAWALYGNAAARTTKEQIKRQGAGLSDHCEVVLELEENGGTSQVVRQMKGANFCSDAAVYTDKKLMARGPQQATEYVTNLLGLDREAFFSSMFAKQKELNTLSDLRPAERKNLIIKMLGIDDIDSAIQKIRQDIRDIDVRIEIMRNTLKDLVSLESTLAAKEAEVRDLKKELEAKTKEEAVLEKRRNEAKSLFSKQEERKDAYQKLVQKYTLTKSQLENSKQNLENAQREHDELTRLKPHADRLQAEIKDFEEVKNKCRALSGLKTKKLLATEKTLQREKLITKLQQEKASKESLKEQISPGPKMTKQLKQLESELCELKEEHEKNQHTASTNQAELASLKEQGEKLNKQSREIKKLGPESKCPACSRPLGEDFTKINDHLSEELSNLTKRIEQKTNELREAQKKVEATKRDAERLEKERKELADRQSGLQVIQKELELRERSIEHHEEELNQVGSQLSAISGQLENYDEERHLELERKFEQLSKKRDEFIGIQASLGRLPEIEKIIAVAKKENGRLSQELAKTAAMGKELDFSQEQYDVIRKTFENAEQEFNEFRLAAKDLRHNFSLLNLEIEKLKKEVEEDKERQSEIKESTAKRQHLDKTQIILGDFRTHLIGRIRPLLSQKATEFLAQVTDGKYSAMEIDEDYDMFIYDEGEKFLIDRFSGGEKDLANLSLRLSISQLITESRGSVSEFIILDEIFGSQDAERKNNILKALARLSNQFRQIFLITHIDDVKDQMECVLSIREDESGISHARLE